jgi:hypothetical protein
MPHHPVIPATAKEKLSVPTFEKVSEVASSIGNLPTQSYHSNLYALFRLGLFYLHIVLLPLPFNALAVVSHHSLSPEYVGSTYLEYQPGVQTPITRWIGAIPTPAIQPPQNSSLHCLNSLSRRLRGSALRRLALLSSTDNPVENIPSGSSSFDRLTNECAPHRDTLQNGLVNGYAKKQAETSQIPMVSSQPSPPDPRITMHGLILSVCTRA